MFDLILSLKYPFLLNSCIWQPFEIAIYSLPSFLRLYNLSFLLHSEHEFERIHTAEVNSGGLPFIT
jgi:hypothetical protein